MEDTSKSPSGTGPAEKLTKAEIPYETFAAMDLRVARVKSAEKHPGADKLIVMQIDLGDYGERQIVAGVAPHYPPEHLVGKTIIVVANLKPVKLRGVESRGMLLAATGGGQVVLLTPMDPAEPGWPVS